MQNQLLSARQFLYDICVLFSQLKNSWEVTCAKSFCINRANDIRHSRDTNKHNIVDLLVVLSLAHCKQTKNQEWKQQNLMKQIQHTTSSRQKTDQVYVTTKLQLLTTCDSQPATEPTWQLALRSLGEPQ